MRRGGGGGGATTEALKSDALKCRRALCSGGVIPPEFVCPLFLAMFFPPRHGVTIRAYIADEDGHEDTEDTLLCSAQPPSAFNVEEDRWVKCVPDATPSYGYLHIEDGAGTRIGPSLRLLMGSKCDNMFRGVEKADDYIHWGALVPWGGSTDDPKTRSAVFSALLVKHAALGVDVDARAMMALTIMQGLERTTSSSLQENAEKFIAAYKAKLTDAGGHADALPVGSTIAQRCMVLRESSLFNDRGALVTVERAAASIAAAVKLAADPDSAVAEGLKPVPSTGGEIVPAGGTAPAGPARSARGPNFKRAISAAVQGANTPRASGPHIAAGSVEDRLKKSKAESGLAGGVKAGLAVAARASTLPSDDVRAYTALVRGVLYHNEALPAVRVLQDVNSSLEDAERAAGTVADATLGLLLKSLGPHLVLKGEQAAVSAHHLRRCFEASTRTEKAIEVEVTGDNITAVGGVRGRRKRTLTSIAGTATSTKTRRRKTGGKARTTSALGPAEKPKGVVACRANRDTGVFEYLVDWGAKYEPKTGCNVDHAIKIGDSWDGEDPSPRYIWSDNTDSFWGDVVALGDFKGCVHVFDDDDDDRMSAEKAKGRGGDDDDRRGAKKAKAGVDDQVEADGSWSSVEVHASWGIDGGGLQWDDLASVRAALAAILSANKKEVGEVVISEVVPSLSQGDDSLDGEQPYDEGQAAPNSPELY